jgi:hypothetical protein
MSACNTDRFFEIQRPQEPPWTTTATYEQGLNACYRIMQWAAMGRGWDVWFNWLPSGCAVKTTTGAAGLNGDLVFYRKFGERMSQLTDIWNQSYQVITMSNLALDLDKSGNGNPFGLDVNSQDYRDNYRRQVAEFHFCRAYAYFFLIRLFAPPYVHNGDNSVKTIPLKSTAAYSKEEVLNEKIGTREEVYRQIISDLQYAKAHLPEKFVLNTWNQVPGYEAGRANKWAASALLGKVFFLTGKHAEAKAEFDDLIASGVYFPDENPKDLYNKEKAHEFPSGAIYEFNGGDLGGTSERHNMYMYVGMVMGLRFRDSQGDELFNSPVNGEGTVMSSWNAFAVAYTALKQMGWIANPAAGDYSETPEALADLRYRQVFHRLLPMPPGTPENTINKGDPGYLEYESFPARAHLTTPHVYIDKFFRGAQGYGRYSKFPLIKITDIYLLRAWIQWKNGDAAAAAVDLNVVWDAANPTNPGRHTAENVTHESIWAEYLREMTGEGWVTDFIMGTQMDAPAGDDPLNTVVSPPYADWYWPIPSNEEALNPNYQYGD